MFCYLGILEGILEATEKAKSDEVDHDHEFHGSAADGMNAAIAALKASNQSDKKKEKKGKKSSIFSSKKRKEKKK
jgi:hypothetical protein